VDRGHDGRGQPGRPVQAVQLVQNLYAK
jgi:hypothetical protein